MHILQLCNDFTGSRVHKRLFHALDDKGLEQTIVTFHWVKERKDASRETFAHAKVLVKNVVKGWQRYLYYYKIHYLFHLLEKDVDLKAIDFIQTSTLFSDGGVAYLASRKYNIPYIVAVRNTDVNDFMKKAPHTLPMAAKILRNASKIVFISPGLQKEFKDNFFIKRIYSNFEHKIVIQPNGIDDYWIENAVTVENNNHNICYVGDFTVNKNIVRLMKSIVAIRPKIKDIHLDIVGGGGEKELKGKEATSEINSLIESYPNIFKFHGEIFDKDKLRQIYAQSSVFAMPSIHETFGLVYIEALSQSLRLLYTKNQGIDGVFYQRIGEAVDPLSLEDIKSALIHLLLHPDNYSNNKDINFEQFRWSNIAENYSSIYGEILAEWSKIKYETE